MKVKTTRKEIVRTSSNIIAIGYCDAQDLLYNHEPIEYTCGVYGWNFDVYYVDGVTICTGYRGMPGRTPKNLRDYEKRAGEILHGKMWTPDLEEEAKEAVEKLLHEFLAQA